MRCRILLPVALLCLVQLSKAQQQAVAPAPVSAEVKAEAKKKAEQQVTKMNKEQAKKLFPSRYPSAKEQQIKKNFENTQKEKNESAILGATAKMPEDMRVPAEHEEIQAVYLSWPAYAFDSAGNTYPIIEPYRPGISIKYKQKKNGDIQVDQYGWPIFDRFVTTAGFFMDTLESLTPYGPLWADLANAIQQEVPVWIQVSSAEDTVALKDYMMRRGTPLSNYRFMINTDGSNAFWVRDSGPVGFYYGNKDSIGFIDMKYYDERDIDDLVPKFLSGETKYPFYTTQLQMEGGNFYTDGYGIGIYSSRVNKANNSMSASRIRDTINNIFGLTKALVPTELLCDGGTGHIDMYIRPLDEERFFVTEYPQLYNRADFRDYSTAENTVKMLQATQGPHGRPYEVIRMPLPTDDAGNYSMTTCNDYNADARGFLNGLFVNKTYIFPAFSNSESGNKAGDEEAKKIYEKYLPGYKIVPIDARALTQAAGAIHCVTMQIPAESPIRIQHASLRGNFSPDEPGYLLRAVITNNKGIESAYVKWRIKGVTEWNEVKLAPGVSTAYTGAIPNQSFAIGDTIEYFIEAKSKSGKVMTQPITAPEGYFSFAINDAEANGVEEFSSEENFSLKIGPNPFSDRTKISLAATGNKKITLSLLNSLGEKISNISEKEISGTEEFYFNGSDLASGVYLLRIECDGKISSRRMIIAR